MAFLLKSFSCSIRSGYHWGIQYMKNGLTDFIFKTWTLTLPLLTFY